MVKRELNQLIEHLRSAQTKLLDHAFFDKYDRLVVKEVLAKDIADAISTAEYLELMAD
jgi:hypothetical protein